MRYLILWRPPEPWKVDLLTGKTLPRAKGKWAPVDDGESIDDRQHAEDEAEGLAVLWPDFEFHVVEVPE